VQLVSEVPAVVVVSGHMVDTPDRVVPRFPPGQVDRVSAEVARVLAAWQVGPGTVIVTGGARGADIIVAEAGLARGAAVKMCLALPPDEFQRRSVELPDSDWTRRFRTLLEVADVETVSAEASADEGEIFARANRRLVEVARAIASRPHGLLVWNGEAGDGRGGTRDFVHQLGYQAPDRRVHVIDPTPREYEARQTAPGPKKLLALDGGGIRGALSLEILRSIEIQLRQRTGDDQLVLSDYFDYISGTSTGAIIATALALGRSVDEVQKQYQSLARQVFTKRFLPMRLRSLYRDRGLTEELDRFLGPGRSLGDTTFKSLLAIVLHNTITDSPWPLSNCTQAKYNRADRNLQSHPDRNLDLPLTTLIRGSTAAPVYFSPQELEVGRLKFLFQDGGLTPFNNPAMLMVLLASLPEYGLQWPIGEENMLVVSVGTGSAAATHPGLRGSKVDLLFTARNLPSVFMRGASVGQDLMCRALGTVRAGAEIDRELGSRLNTAALSTPSLFTYLRYDADLSDEALKRRGITSSTTRRRMRRLDAVNELGLLRDVGREVGARVDLTEHFRGFI
jgi:hypothetical protein